MNQKITSKAIEIAQSPKTKQALMSMKPERTVWSFLGVIVFLIVPEIVAFIWGGDITAYAKEAVPTATSAVEQKYYELLIMLFEEGGSWINLGIGAALLVWLFF